METGGPQWTTAGRRYVPSHLNPGSTRSSFAKPFERGSGAPESPSQPTSFGTKSHSASSANGPLMASITDRISQNDDLPPTQSIKISRGNTLNSLRADGSSVYSRGAVNTTAHNRLTANSSAVNAIGNDDDGYSVVVFGFPPGMTQTVIQHFGKFGEIVENIPHSGSSPNTSSIAANTTSDSFHHSANTTRRPASIECGRNWLRIAYKDKSSAMRALGENGRVLPGQYVVGCVPVDSSDSGLVVPSSTNSLLIDDSDTSFLPDLSVLDDDVPQSTQNNLGSQAGSLPGLTTNRIAIRPPSSSLFKADNSLLPKRTEALAVPEPVREQPKDWKSWALQKARELIYGWDDL